MLLALLFSLRFHICCFLTADVIHCTLCSGFFAISISLRFHRYLDFQFVLFPFIGVFSFLFGFSFPGIRNSFSVFSLIADVFHCFYDCKILPASIALALRFALPACSLLFVPYYRFFLSLYFTPLCSVNFALVFSGMRSSLFVVASWLMCLFLCYRGSSRRHFNLFLFPV